MLKSVADRLGIHHPGSPSLAAQNTSGILSPSSSGTSMSSTSSHRSSILQPPSRVATRQQPQPQQLQQPQAVASKHSPSLSPSPTAGSSGYGFRKTPTAALAPTLAPKPVPPPLATHDHMSLASPIATNVSSPDRVPSPASVMSSSSTTTGSHVSKTENVTVTVRIRPFSKSELSVAGGPTEVWDVVEDCKIAYTDDYAVSARRVPVEYIYDHAMIGSNNEQIYGTSVKNLVQSAMEGYNGTVFAYGQTSSGKTYTMSGNEQQPGITPRAIEDIFKYIRENPDREFLLRVSYLEIYNESIRDLLSPESNDLRIHEDKRRGVYVSPLKEEIVTTPSQVMRIIERGDHQRHVSSTDFNAHSSRSHSIFQIVIESRDRSSTNGSPTLRKPIPGAKSSLAVRVSQLNLIDLAGSEKATTDVERRKEGAFINKSLLTLGTVISRLTEEKGAGHIPYRDSKLTRILQSSLNGSARVSVICTTSPSYLNVEESHNTLKFAARVKKVVTRAQTNQVMDDKALLEKYRREISELKAQLTVTVSQSGESSSPSGLADGANGAISKEQQAEVEQLLETERQRHQEEISEMSLARNALKERIDHLTKLILTSQSISTKATASESPVVRNTVETSADGTVFEFPKEVEMRLTHKDAMVKQLQSELEAQHEKTLLLTAALEKAARGESVDFEKTLGKTELEPRERFLMEKRASVMSINSLNADGSPTDAEDLAAILAMQQKNGHAPPPRDRTRTVSGLLPIEDGDEDQDESLMDTPWSRAELKSLRQAKRELEIVVMDQERKIEEMVAFEDSDEFRNIILELEAQREKIVLMEEEREGFRSTVHELRSTIRKLELRQQHSGSAGAGGNASGLPVETLGRIKDLEMAAQRERRHRLEEQSRHMGKITSLEAELTMLRAELSVRDLAGY